MPPTPHEVFFLQMTEQDYHIWRHHPVTAAYLRYLQEQAEAFRTAAADLLEAGQLAPQSDLLRGRILTLRELHSLDLETIQNFYRQEETNADAGRRK